MELAQLLSRVDHTLLTQTATWPEIRQLCDDGLRCGCASVCIPPSYVKQAVGYLAGQLRHRLPQRLQHHSGQVL